MLKRDSMHIAKKSLAPALAFAAASLCIGCVFSPSGPSSDATGGNDALRGSDDSRPHCSRVWSAAKADSVLYCPEVTPPGAP